MTFTACSQEGAAEFDTADVEVVAAAPAAEEEAAAEVVEDETSRSTNWSDDSHSNDAEPNYNVVFPQDEVQQVIITIAPEDWEAMQANMVELLGEPGTGGGRPGSFPPPADGERPEGFQPPAEGELPEVSPPPAGGERPEGFQPPAGGPGGFGGGSFTSENPMWVEATIEFNGATWEHVGVRYKGNSSLNSGWREGANKLPLKLDFDEFEDAYPEIDNQRFYGFKQLSLANGFSDASFLRDAATYDILEAAGLPASETAWYEVILDYGEGQQSLGLYTLIEVIDDTVIEREFGGDDGNIYEADGSAASLAFSTYNQIEASFQKENNEESADYSDIQTLFDVLHSDERSADPSAWRESLETIFDVDSFLEWLAISAVIEHWDTYGQMSHNYYLYNDPETGRLTWISWDHNMAMGGFGGGRGGFPGGNAPEGRVGGRGGGFGRAASLDQSSVTDDWPLIRYLLDDAVYYEQYIEYVAATVEGVFDADAMAAKYAAMADVVAPYASADVDEAAFDTAVQALIDHAYEREMAVAEFLAETGR